MPFNSEMQARPRHDSNSGDDEFEMETTASATADSTAYMQSPMEDEDGELIESPLTRFYRACIGCLSSCGDMLSRLDKTFHRNGKHLLTGQPLDDPAPLNWFHLLLIFIFVILIPTVIQAEFERFPEIPDFGISESNLNEPLLDTDQFVAMRAKHLLVKMTSFGLRTMGSEASEVNTVGLITNWLNKIQQTQIDSPVSRLTYTVDLVNGVSPRSSTVFLNLTNILARVDPIRGNTKDAFLVNCHFDVTFESMGASDNGINCAIMLEMIRALMTSKTPLKNSVIFLFNGAEEYILLGSYAFLQGDSKDGGYVKGAGHPWSKQVRTFLNIEASGSGGREILFQTGPGAASPILLRAYAAGAKHPFASVIGQEIFQSGIIPSTTDFQIFNTFGNLPGIDIAFYSNGYVYHTRYDTPDRIADGTYQRAGTNYLGIVRELANSNIADIPQVNSTGPNEKLVFFDFFSYFMIIYPFDSVGLAGVILITIGVVARIVLKTVFGKAKFGKMFGFTFLAQFLTVLTTIGMFVFLGYVIGLSPQCMFWYSNPWLVIPIYVFPAATLAIAVHAVVFKFLIRRYLKIDHDIMCISAYNTSFDVAFILCTMIVVALQAMRIASSYLLVVYLVCPLIIISIIDIVLFLVQRRCRIRYSNGWLLSLMLILQHAAVTLFSTLYFFYIAVILIEVMVPIYGRSSVNENPEYIITAIVAALTILVLLFHAPVVHLSGGNILRLTILTTLFVFGAFIAVFATTAGSSFSVDQALPRGVREQRSTIQLTLVNRDSDNQNSTRAGLWYQPSDYLRDAPLRSYSSELDSFFTKSRTTCSSNDDIINLQPFCLNPTTYPVGSDSSLQYTFWADISVSSTTVSRFKWPNAELVQRNIFANGINFLQFRIYCGDTPHCMFTFVKFKVTVLGHRFDQEQIPINDPNLTFTLSDLSFQPVRFGSSISNERVLFLTVAANIGRSIPVGDQPYLYFAVGSQYVRTGVFSSPSDGLPQELADFCQLLPDWHHTSALTGVYNEHFIYV